MKLFLSMFAVCVALVFGAKFALAATTADSWNGEWVREGSISGYFAKLTIKDATDKSLSYYLDSVEGGHVCNVSNGEEMNFEKATIVGDVAISQPYSDNGDLNNVLDPTYMMKLVKDKDIITRAARGVIIAASARRLSAAMYVMARLKKLLLTILLLGRTRIMISKSPRPKSRRLPN